MGASSSVSTYSPDGLIAGNSNLLTSQSIVLISGQNLKRGAVLGKITAGGKYNLSLAAAGDGSETPDLILAEDTDASAADVATVAYHRGDFDENKIILGAGHTAASIREGLRSKAIVLIPSTVA